MIDPFRLLLGDLVVFEHVADCTSHQVDPVRVERPRRQAELAPEQLGHPYSRFLGNDFRDFYGRSPDIDTEAFTKTLHSTGAVLRVIMALS